MILLSMLATLTLAVLTVFVFTLCIQLFYLLRFFLPLGRGSVRADNDPLPPLSVVICARNESKNIVNHLPHYFQQDYPEFQVVVVNDCSTDESIDILEEFEKKHSNLHVIHLKEDEIREHDKKLALTLGIKGAKHQHLVLTDMDCVPHHKNWLRHMASGFKGSAEIVLGYGAYKVYPGMLNRLIRFDTFQNALFFLGFANKGRPYMGVGRNLAYTRDLFFRNKGFASQYHIQSGDDDLFVNKVCNRNNTHVIFHEEAITLSEPKRSFFAWMAQKRRHLTTSTHYRTTDKFRLSFYYFSLYLYLLSFIVLLWSDLDPNLLAGLFSLRLIIYLICTARGLDRVNERGILFFSPIFELVLMLIYPAMHIGNLFSSKHPWK